MDKIATGAIVFLTFVASPHQSGLTPSLNIAQSVTLPSPTPQQFKTYEVQSGDTLASIAKAQYGSEAYWTNLWNDNPEVDNPAQIHAGQTLKIENQKSNSVLDLNQDLQKKFDLLHPSPTPSPTPGPTQTSVIQGTASNFDSVYQAAGSKYGVPWQILYGLHQMETGGRDGAITSGYGTGAQGPLQFMPGTWAVYGVDGNGDGTVDINNAIDAIYTAANFLSAHGGVDAGLKAYGGDSILVLSYARSRGYNQ